MLEVVLLVVAYRSGCVLKQTLGMCLLSDTHLLPLFRLFDHGSHRRVELSLPLLLLQRCTGINPPEGWVSVTLAHVPPVKLLHVRDEVQAAARWLEGVSVFRQKRVRDNAAPVVLHLEVRVGEAEEELAELPALEVVGEVAHRIGAQHGCVAVLPGFLHPQGFDAQPHELAHLGSDFHAKGALFGVEFGERNREPTEPAAHVENRRLGCCALLAPFWVERAPITLVGANWILEGVVVAQRIDVGTGAIESFLRHFTLFGDGIGFLVFIRFAATSMFFLRWHLI
mmetsp:Transcript_5850/g.11014  ORF Transcript_5850/g.11014 Transcript_5850/m.11014 type:complete len:283 (+) Transcript_5850:444-1292(+)